MVPVPLLLRAEGLIRAKGHLLTMRLRRSPVSLKVVSLWSPDNLKKRPLARHDGDLRPFTGGICKYLPVIHIDDELDNAKKDQKKKRQNQGKLDGSSAAARIDELSQLYHPL